MNPDPTIAAIRDVRHRISAAVGHDPKRLVEYYQRLQEEDRDRLIPKRGSESRRAELDQAIA